MRRGLTINDIAIVPKDYYLHSSLPDEKTGVKKDTHSSKRFETNYYYERPWAVQKHALPFGKRRFNSLAATS